MSLEGSIQSPGKQRSRRSQGQRSGPGGGSVGWVEGRDRRRRIQ